MASNISPATKLLKSLVAIPSVNPAFAQTGDQVGGEEGLVAFLESWATQRKLPVSFQKVAAGRRNILIRLPPKKRVQNRIVLAPHMDTVTVDSADALIPQIQGERLYGRGACDTKGSIAAFLTALANLQRGPNRPESTEIVFVGLVDEENEQLGSRYFAEKYSKKIDLAIVGEPTFNKVVTAHKGDVWLELETIGKSAHGANPHLGDNAVTQMARIVSLIEGPYAQKLAKITHPLLGSPTVNVGTIRGGTQPNIVPHQCVIRLDRRTLPGESMSTVKKELINLLNKAGLKARFRPARAAECRALETDPNQAFVPSLMAAAKQKAVIGVDYFCDASHLSAGGIPSVVFGPGKIAQAHTREEWISLRSLDRGVQILTRFLSSLP